MPSVIEDEHGSVSPPEQDQEDQSCIAWSGISKSIPVLLFFPEAAVSKDGKISSTGERYHLAFKIVRTESRLVRGILTNHGFSEVHQNSNDFNLMWTGSHLKPYILRSLQDFQKVNHFPRSYELTRKDRLYKNIQRMQQTHGFKNFNIVPQTFVLPSEYQEFCNCFVKDKGPWIIKPVASSRGRGIYLVSNPNQISVDENILVSRYINNPLLIDDFKFDVRLYVLVTSYDPLLIYVYEEGLARFATVKYDRTSKSIKNLFMHLTNYSVNKKSSDYVSCDDPEVEDYGNKWSMSAVLRYLKQEGKDTTLLMRQVEDLIIKAILSAECQIADACKSFVPHKTNCFELYGFDVLIDANLKPWLLEVNLSPSLACDAPLDLKIKASMVADMFSLVGFVCQDPLSRHPRSDRLTLDPGLKNAVAQRCQQRQRPSSEGNSEPEGSKDKAVPKQGQGDSTLSLTAEEIKAMRRMREEYERRGGFIRIFPTAETWEHYSGYLESKTSLNYILANRLFHGRNLKGNVQLQVDALHGCHVVQYERKLLSLETRKKRRRHLSHRHASGKRRSGKESRTSLTASGSQEGEGCALERRPEVEAVPEPDSHRVLVAELKKQMVTQLDSCHAEALSSSAAAGDSARPKINLLNILHQGWDLSKVQARMAFSSYLQRVQQRLLAESQANAIPAWPDKDNEQMELVIRFLKRAASNLQHDIKVVFPNPHLPLQDRRRILSYQLGEFIRCYNKETDHMARKHEHSKVEHCVSTTMFQEYISAASENDLEEVLTFYTQKNKSSSVFLGTKRSGRKGFREGNASSNCENSKTLPLARKDSSASEHSHSMRKIGSDPDIKAAAGPLPDQQSTFAARPEVQGSQHSSSFPVTLDSPHIHPHGDLSASASLPLHCPPPPASQPPSYAQSLAKSQYCRPEALSEPPAYSSPSSAALAQSPRSLWTSIFAGAISGVQPVQGFRRIHSSSVSSSGATSSVPSATLTYDQKLSRPFSSGQVIRRSASDKLKSSSAGAFKELSSLSGPSNQQAFISALQKLADKQAVRQYASSSHINLLTQQLSKMNLANRVLSKESFMPSPRERHPTATAAAAAQRPVKAMHSGAELYSSTGRRPAKDEETTWNGQLQSTYGLTRAANPPQYYQPTQGRCQLQFAVQKLQQQRLQPQQFLDQSHFRHPTQLSEQTSALHAQASAASPSCPPSSYHVWTSHGHSHSQTACVSPALVPKPPSSFRDGQTRKTATKRLIKQTSAESSASGSASSSQRAVYEAICNKTGLTLYHKLFQGQEPAPR